MHKSEGKIQSMGTRLFVRNLPFNMTDSEVRTVFAKIGEVRDCHVVTDRETGRSKGFGFVDMNSEAETEKAIAEINGMDFNGRSLSVSEARPREERPAGMREPRPFSKPKERFEIKSGNGCSPDFGYPGDIERQGKRGRGGRGDRGGRDWKGHKKDRNDYDSDDRHDRRGHDFKNGRDRRRNRYDSEEEFFDSRGRW